jgi:hypothetical protein
VTDTLTRKLALPEWVMDLDPASDDFVAYIEGLAENDRRELAEWLAGLSPDATFEALGYVPTIKQWELHDLQPWSEGGPWDALYGGAAGGGKTKGLLMDALANANRHHGLEAWLVRATYPELRDSFVKELEGINFAKHQLGARWNEGKHTLTLPNTSTLKLRHARTIANAGEMLSAECQVLYIDERTTMIPKVLEKLSIRVRSSDSDLPIIGIRSGSNPGDVGHMDCKVKFFDPAPLGHRRIRVVTKKGARIDRYFIPAKIGDNPHLDDGYEDRLSMLPADLERAYREGDWSIFEGMAFGEFRVELHVIPPELYPLERGYPLGVGIDYGVSNPFCALWGMKLPDNLIVVYRELYETDLTPADQAQAIIDSETDWERMRGQGNIGSWLDPSCWARQPNSPKPIAGSPPKLSIAADYRATGVHVNQAYNDRMGGKRLVHVGLKVQRDGRPRLLISSACTNLIRTLPNLPRDKVRPEDVDTKAEDHAYDALRYLLGGLTGRTNRPVRTYGEELRSTRAQSMA